MVGLLLVSLQTNPEMSTFKKRLLHMCVCFLKVLLAPWERALKWSRVKVGLPSLGLARNTSNMRALSKQTHMAHMSNLWSFV